MRVYDRALNFVAYWRGFTLQNRSGCWDAPASYYLPMRRRYQAGRSDDDMNEVQPATPQLVLNTKSNSRLLAAP